jgi:hypothetical protein
LWEIIRRHPDYIEFCSKYEQRFDGDQISFLDKTRLSNSEKLEYERIKDRFRLADIYN